MAQYLLGQHPDAPFRKYNKTDDDVRLDGFQTGLQWPAKWQHVPGGPYYPSEPKTYEREHPDWTAYRKLLRHHSKVWIAGWFEGFAENAKTNHEIKVLRDRLLMDKLAA